MKNVSVSVSVRKGVVDRVVIRWAESNRCVLRFDPPVPVQSMVSFLLQQAQQYPELRNAIGMFAGGES